jgi:hypothetical protein
MASRALKHAGRRARLDGMTVHRLTITGDATFVGRIKDEIREQYAAVIADDSWTVTPAGDGILEFNTTDLMMIMNTPLVVLTDVQVDAVVVSGPRGHARDAT